MRAALEQLKGLENLSGDLYEKIAKALSVMLYGGGKQCGSTIAGRYKWCCNPSPRGEGGAIYRAIRRINACLRELQGLL